MPIRVTCDLYGPLRDAVGKKSVEREVDADGTVGNVFDVLAEEYPEIEALMFDNSGDEFSDSVVVMRNGRNVAFENGVDTDLEDGDTLSASPPAEGG